MGEREVLRGDALRLRGLPHGRHGHVELAVQLGQVRHAGQRRQVGSQRQHRRGRVVCLVVSPELDEGVDLDRASDGRPRRHVDGASRGLESRRELVLAELEAADPDEDERVVRRQAARPFERRFGRGIQRRIGRLADPLEEGEAEVALGAGVGWVTSMAACNRSISSTVADRGAGGGLAGGPVAAAALVG